MADYGKPGENHLRTAYLWDAYLLAKYGPERHPGPGICTLSPEDVCWMNLLQKLARQMEVHKRDNLVDIIGYTINVDLLA